MTFDLDRARAETRGCNDRIHFNNAGASLPPAPVSDTLYDYLRQEEYLGGYETAAKNAEALAHFYQSAAALLNCAPDNIAYAENATRAWDLVFFSFTFKPGERILTTVAEYGSNVIAYNQQARRYGAEVVFVPNDEHGQLDTSALEALIDERVKLISISHIPTGGGLVNPAKAIGKIANAAGIPYLLDACQSVGQLALDVDDIGCDALCATGRKYLRGPRGTGLLYIRQRLMEQLEPAILDQHSADLLSSSEYRLRPDARRFETWEQYCAGKAALGVAMDYAQSWGLDTIQQQIYRLATELRARLNMTDGVTVTDQGLEQCGIVTFTAAQKTANDIKNLLANRQINVSISGGSGSLVSFQQRGLDAVVRASLHYYNTAEEIDAFMTELGKILRL